MVKRGVCCAVGCAALLAGAAFAEDPRLPDVALEPERDWGGEFEDVRPASRAPREGGLTQEEAAALDPLAEAVDRSWWAATVTMVEGDEVASPDDVTPGGATLDDEARSAVARAVASGAARVAHVLRGSGGSGEGLWLADGRDAFRTMSMDDESSIGAVVKWPTTGWVRTGARVFVAVAATGDGRWRLSYRALWSGEARASEPPPQSIDHVTLLDVPVLSAEGFVDLRPGETAAIRVAVPGSAKRLVLLRVDGEAPEFDDVTTLPSGRVAWFAFPPAPATKPVTVSTPTPWTSIDAPAAPPPSDGAAKWVEGTWRGFHVGTATDADRARQSHRSRRGAIAVRIAQDTSIRIEVPTAPGAPFAVFAGRLFTRVTDWDLATGCHDSLAILDRVERLGDGLGCAGVAHADGVTDIAIAQNWERGAESRDTVGWRGLPGHRTKAEVPFVASLPRSAAVSVAASVSRDAPLRAFGFDVRATPSADVAAASPSDPQAAPVVVVVGDARIPVRPGGRGGCAQLEWTSHLSWRSEGSCGMRVRLPVASAVATGFDVTFALARSKDRLDVDAFVGGAPEPHPALDTLDGAYDIVRSPVLRYRATGLAPPADGLLAWDGPLQLRVGVPDSSGTRLRVTFGDGAGCVLPSGGDAAAELGGETALPVAWQMYSSNHDTAELSPELGLTLDGWSVRTFAAAGDAATRLLVDWRSRPTWTRRELAKTALPVREGEQRGALAFVRRMHRTLNLLVPAARGLSRAAEPGGVPSLSVTTEPSPGGPR